MATTFVWSGRTRQGETQKGELVAKTREEVIAQLRKQNIMATSVQPKPGEYLIERIAPAGAEHKGH